MGIDLSEDYKKANDKINAYKTVSENKKTEIQGLKNDVSKKFNKKKSELVKDINELKSGNNQTKNNAREKEKNQLEQLLDLFKSSLPKSGNDSMAMISKIFLTAAEKTKEKLKNALITEIVDTIDCSEEQTYKVNEPIYIKVSQVDLFKRLKYSPTDKSSKYYYEKVSTGLGVIPNSLNRSLYERLQSIGQSYESQFGGGYMGLSGQELFDIEYVQFYPEVNPTNFDDYFKVTLKSQPNGISSISEFLTDYYGSLDILEFNTLSAEILNSLTGAFDFDIGLGSDEIRSEKKFELILKRIMGICNDTNKKIDVSGTAKLKDEDIIDDSFFDVSNQELRQIENEIELITNGVIEFESCDNIRLPINVPAVSNIIDEIISENKSSSKIDSLLNGLDKLSKDPNWDSSSGLSFKLPTINVKIKSDLDFNLITNLPKMIFKTIISPKVLLGLLIMVKSSGSILDIVFDDLKTFMKKFKKLTVNFMRKIFEIFIKELFIAVKKNIKELVEVILLDIIKETKNKQVAMYSSIIYILMVVGQAIVDYRNCKSVIDEILKLLNLGLIKLNTGLPLFVLSGAKFLPGISDTRSFANVIENLQKAGLPTGDAPDGTPNMMNMMLKSNIKGVNKEMAENGKTEITIPKLEVITPPFGGQGMTVPTKGYGKSY